MAAHPPIPIAVIGIGCRLPGDVTNTEELWKLLVEGRNAWSPVPSDRFNEEAFYHPNPDNSGTTNHRGGHFIRQDVAAFDAAFFGISPMEARGMDPQQRLLLETTYEAFETAGIPIEHVRGSSTAVYTAMFTRDYDRNIYKDPNDIPKYHITGSGEAILANRISYIFDLVGPSMTLDTGCSGSLVALHQACQSLRTGESNMALASGVNLILNPDHMFGMSNLHMLSDTGRSHPFDSRGSGYGRGEGVTTVLIKRLDDALQAGDPVRAIIRNTAVNHDGKTNGITLPNQRSQESLERSIYQGAGLDPHNICYVEAHGTGTAAGDLAELQGIANVFCGNDRQHNLYVGSIKSNIGHLESSSGLAGLIKTILILEKGFIPPNADFLNRKQDLKLEDWKMEVPVKLEPWPCSGPRQASVNSFGYGGMNAHLIVESAATTFRAQERIMVDEISHFNGNGVKTDTPRTFGATRKAHASVGQLQVCKTVAGNGTDTLVRSSNTSMESVNSFVELSDSTSAKAMLPTLYVVSARSEKSILEMVDKLKDWASTRYDYENYFKDLAYTLSSRRSLMQWRYTFVASSYQELVVSLKRKSPTVSKVLPHSDLPVGFIFTGQGAQWFAMGRELIFTDSPFSKSIFKSDRILREIGASWNLIDELLLDESSSRINQSEIAQPASTAIQIALVDLLNGFGIRPQLVLGHSSGEIAAAYAAGVLSHSAAMKVSYCRSFVSSLCKRTISSKGAMLSVGLGEDDVTPLLAETRRGVVYLACANSPFNSTISGDEAAILEIEEALHHSNVFNRRLKVDTAYHSHHMRKVAHEYLRSLGIIETQRPQENITFMSTVTASIKTSDFGAAYWVENLVSKVRFADAMSEYLLAQFDSPMKTQANHIFIEIGPHSALAGPTRQIISQNSDSFKYTYLSTLSRGKGAIHTVLESIGKMFEHGLSVDLEATNSLRPFLHQPIVIHDLPAYPWDHSNTYWYESRLSKEYRLRRHGSHELLGVRMVSSTSIEPIWRHIVSLERLPWLAEHVIDDLVIFPGAGYLAMAIEAISQFTLDKDPSQAILDYILKNVSFLKALVIPSSPTKIEMQISLRRKRIGSLLWYEFCVSALSQEDIWHEHCRGLIKINFTQRGSPTGQQDGMDLVQSSGLTKEDLLDTMAVEDSQIFGPELIYSQLRSNGNFYGPTFAAIQELKLGDAQAIARVRIPDVQSIMPSEYMQQHVIHPTTLDALMHTSLPLYTQTHGPGSIMPVSIGQMSVSSGIANQQGETLIVGTSIARNGIRSAEVEMHVFPAKGEPKQEPVLIVSQLELRGLGDTHQRTLDFPTSRDMSYQMKWGVDVDYLSFAIKRRPALLSWSDYFGHLHFKHSKMAILQIGADGGNAAVSILEAFGDYRKNSVDCYDFTDFSSESFPLLENLHEDWMGLLHFKALDLRHDPLEQGFVSQSYHLIVVTTLPNKASSMETNLFNAHKLLTPGGRLFIFPGNSSNFSDDQLHDTLLRCSFSGIELYLNNLMGKFPSDTMITSKALSTNDQARMSTIKIIAEKGTEAFSSDLCINLTNQDFEASFATWDTDFSRSQIVYIVVDSGQRPLLVDPTPERFRQITTMTGAKSNVLWMSVHEDASAAMNPAKGLVIGLARSARAENENLKLITFDVQETITSCLPELLQIIPDIVSKSFGTSTQADSTCEVEYAYHSGQVLIPRLLPDTNINAWMAKAAGKPTTARELYGQRQRPLKLSMIKSELNESLVFVDDESIQASLASSKVEIAVRAHVLNSRDVSCIPGHTEASSTIIRELAGIVSAVGSDASTNFRVGDRVCAWSANGAPYPNFVQLDKENLSRLPDSISLTVGATLPIPLMTAFHSFVELADLQRGQKILIYGAKSDLGRAALILAREIGAESFVTVSTVAQKEEMIAGFGILPNHIFSDEEPNLKQRILKLTEGKGVDAILKVLDTDTIHCDWDSVATFGICILIGSPVNLSNGQIQMPLPRVNATFVSFDLETMASHRPRKIERLLGQSMSMLKSAAMLPAQEIVTIPIGKIDEAFGLIQARNHIARVVLEVVEDTQVKTLVTRHPASSIHQTQLDGGATYIIAGGLGDLGQRLCRLMASRGAKYLLILSRRVLAHDKKQELQDELRSISVNLVVHSIACDISNSSMVQNMMLLLGDMNLPPIKGILQSATVLQDRVLERMSATDFHVPLQTKLHGTLNLIEAFKAMPLDFFVMLSSLSGTVGSRGQANYAAGNTFQDALAHSENNSKTHFTALSLGMIEGTSAYGDHEGQARVQNLLRQGWIPIGVEELLAFLDYAMSAEARNDQCRHSMIGIDGRSIYEAANATPTMRSPMFVHVRKSYDGGVRNGNTPAIEGRKDTIADAQTFEQVHKIITATTAQKLSSLIALDCAKMNFESPLLDFGLDSLTAIELKNWIAHEFNATIQASEILDAPSLVALSKRVASRSTLVPEKFHDSSRQEIPAATAHFEPTVPKTVSTPLSSRIQQTAPALARLPLPDLESTLELYHASASPFLSKDQLRHTTQVMTEFGEGFGRELQERLLDRTLDPQINDWQYELQVNNIYLRRRDPVYPYGIFYGAHMLTEIQHSQAERAAITSIAAFEFKQRIDLGELKQDYLNEEPLCMDSLEWLFNANRRPFVGVDKVYKYPGNDYLVALRRGHVFKVKLTEGGKLASYTRLEAAFQSMLTSSETRIPAVVTLSADGRNSWAEIRKLVKSLDQANSDLIDMIEAAAFVICLDDGAPKNPTERCNQFLLGDPANRWSDKTLQFVVCENGSSAYICEHSKLDAASLKQMNEHVTRAILEHGSQTHTNGSVHHLDDLFEEHRFTTNKYIESHIDRIGGDFNESHAPAEFTHFNISTVGGNLLRAHKVPKKPGAQLIIQIACLLYFGQQYPCWETLTMMLFHKGRLDWMQVVSSTMSTFCKAEIDGSTAISERSKLLREAVNAHASTMTRIGRGKGFSAHLESLREVLHEDEPVPAFFKDPTWEMMRVTSTRKIKTDASEGLMVQESGFLMPDPESVWVHYEVEDENCKFWVQSTKGRTSRFCDKLREAAERIRELLK